MLWHLESRSINPRRRPYGGLFLAAVLSVACVLCGCGGGAIKSASTAATSQLTLSAATLDFANVTVNTTSTKTLTLTSSETAPVTVSSLTVAGAGFSISGPTLPATLNPGQSLALQVSFVPTVAGAASGAITVSSNSSTSNTATVSLSGVGTSSQTSAQTSPQLTLSASTLAFDDVTVNTTSNKTLTLTSSGTEPVTVSALTVAGAGFSISGATLPATLNPGQSLTLQASFVPTVAGAASGTITVSSNSSSSNTAIVSLSGNGTSAQTPAQTSPQLTLSAGTLAFGSVILNTTTTQSLTLNSSGTAPVTVTALTVGGIGFSISGATLPVTLNPGQSLTLQVSFVPTVAGAANGTITVSSNSSTSNTAMVTLSGTGASAQTSPQLTLSASTLAFGDVTVNTTSTKTLTLTSAGTAPVTISALTAGGIGFSISGATLPVTLNPGQSLTLQVSFVPTVAGAANGTITVSSNSSTSNTAMVTLSGTGASAQTSPRLTLSASTLAFGDVTVNTTSTRTLTLTSAGTAPVTVSALTAAGAGFAISGATLPATLNPGQSLTLQVSFVPTVAGAASGTITVSSNSSTASVATVSLSGTATNVANPVLTLSTTTLSFGNQPIGTPVTQMVTLTSTGTSPVTVNAANITGAGFTFSGATFPVTLNPTIAITIPVQFNPTAVGAASGTLTFTSNSTTATTTVVNLSGTGTAVQHKVSLSWTAPANSPVPVTGYNVYRATGSSTSYQILSPGNTQTSYVDQAVAGSTTYSYYVTSIDTSGTESAPSNQVTVTIP
jgi:hypothetical protein